MKAKTVLISGAGVGGPTLAFWLKAGGFAPTLVERAPALRTGGFVLDLWGLGYDLAERMGLTESIERVGYHVRELRIVDAHGKRVAGFGARVFRELTGGRFITLARSDLSRLLFEKIKDETEVVFGDEIVSLDAGPDKLRVRFKHGDERAFDLVVGADGLHSGVRRLLFGPQDRFEKHLGYIVAAFEVSGYRPRDDDVYVIFSAPGRMLGRVALRNDRTLFLFVFTAGADSLEARDVSRQRALLRARYGDGQWESTRILAELDRADDLYFDQVSQIKMPVWSRGRVALVGDAAFCVSLTAGQGSALAMTGAYTLAGELVKAAGRHDVAFPNYEARLRDYLGAKQKGAERFSAAFAPRTRWGLFLRNQVINACALPGLSTLTFGRGIVDTLSLPDYVWPAMGPGG